MRKDSKLFRNAAVMDPGQLAAHVALLEGRAALLGTMVIMPTRLGWIVRTLDTEDGEHTVYNDLSACSCPDNRFRKHECKHIKALRTFLGSRAS